MDLNLKAFVVVGTALTCKDIFNYLARVALNNLLKHGFVILDGTVLSYSFVNIFKYKFFRFVHAAVKIDCGNNSLKCVRLNRRTLSAACYDLALAEHEVLAELNLTCK